MNTTVLLSLSISELQNIILECMQASLKIHQPNVLKQESTAEKKFLSLRELCKHTSLKAPTVYKLVSEGKIPFIKANGTKKLLFETEVINQWILNNRRLA